MASDLPTYISFGFRPHRYVARRIMRLETNDSAEGKLVFDKSEVIDRAAPTLTKFELQLAKDGNRRFRHIRSCYNNKYLSRRNNTTMRITASADQPEEDRSNPSCTLFEILGNYSTTVRLRHVATGLMAVVNNRFLGLHVPGGPEFSEFSIVDWSSIVIFPNFVTIKGDNGMYLNADSVRHGTRFIKEDDIADNKSIMYRVSYQSDGSVRFYAIKNQCLLRRLPPGLLRPNPGMPPITSDVNGVWATNDYSQFETSGDRSFWPRKYQTSSNEVVLRNAGNNMFCVRNTRNAFRADSNQANFSTCILEVNEAVLSRSIYNVRYRLSDARIYNEAPIPDTHPATNNNSTTMVRELKFSFEVEETASWGHSVNVEGAFTTTFMAGVPFMARGELSVSVYGGYERTWEKTETTTKAVEVIHTVFVPPHSRVIVTLVVTKGTCDIPFSYTRRDVLMDGRTVITDHDDGLYTGVSHYNFKYETSPPQDLS